MPSRRSVLAAGGAGVASLAGCRALRPGGSQTETPSPTAGLSVTGAWPQGGSDAGHRGVVDAAGVPNDGAVHWQLERHRSGPAVVADDKLFHVGRVGEPEACHGFGKAPSSSPTESADGHEALFCRDVADGTVRWTRRVSPSSSWPVVAGGNVMTAGQGFVTAFRADDGQRVWTHDIGDRFGTARAATDGRLLVSTQFVRQGDRAADVRAYRVGDGELHWTGDSHRWEAHIAASPNVVISLSPTFQVGTVVTARRMTDGSHLWSVKLDDNGLPSWPVVAGDTAYVVPDDGGLHAFDIHTGTRRWHYEASTSNWVGLAVTADEVFLTDDGVLRVLAADTGTEQWSASTGGDAGYQGQPAVGSEAVYLSRGMSPTDLVVLSRSDGHELWSHPFPMVTVECDLYTSGLAAQPAVVGGALFAYAADGLYAFGPEQGSGE